MWSPPLFKWAFKSPWWANWERERLFNGAHLKLISTIKESLTIIRQSCNFVQEIAANTNPVKYSLWSEIDVQDSLLFIQERDRWAKCCYSVAYRVLVFFLCLNVSFLINGATVSKFKSSLRSHEPLYRIKIQKRRPHKEQSGKTI